MELIDLLKVIWRWLWLIAIVIAVTLGFLWVRTENAEVVYSSDVTLLFFTPDREDVAVSDEYNFTNDRDEITNAADRFVQIIRHSEVKDRVQRELEIDENYSVSAETELGADFVHVTVFADTPELAQQIANVHVDKAVEYFGEIRALPATQALNYYDRELADAQEELREAQRALVDFQLNENIISLEDEMAIQTAVLEELEIVRTHIIVPDPENLTLRQNTDFSDVEDIEARIEVQRGKLSDLAQLQPEYNRLQNAITLAQRAYNDLVTSTDYTQEQFDEVEQALNDAQDELASFRAQQGIVSLQSEINLQNAILENLEMLRAEAVSSDEEMQLPADNNRDTTIVDDLIETQRERLARLAELRPEYEALQSDINRAQQTVDTLSSEYAETELRQSFASEAMFIQKIEDADLSSTPISDATRLFVLGAIASLGGGILLAFFLDYIVHNL